MRPALHFVGFRGNEYARACRTFGKPDFIHYVWDRRAKREIAPADVIVFAKGDERQPVARFNGPDIFEDLPA